MSDRRVPGLPRFRSVALAATLVASACSGVGVRTPVNPYQLMCMDEKAYLQAVGAADAAKVSEAVARMRSDADLMAPQPRRLALKSVDAASKGDPSLIRQDYRANCLPLPSPSPTTPGASPSGS